MYTKISDYVTCYNPYCIAIHIAYDTEIENDIDEIEFTFLKYFFYLIH